MTPSWYDVLGVDDDDSADEIRAAWQESIAGLDPTDRRFKQRNRAAEVLLDPRRRAAHDAELSADDEGDDEDDDVPGAGVPIAPSAPSAVARKKTDTTGADSRSSGVPAWVMVLAGMLATVLVVLSVLSLARGGDTAAADEGGSGTAAETSDELPDGLEVEAARVAAETAIVPVLAYDYRDLERSKQAALTFLTTSFGAEYRRNFEGTIEPNARRLKAIINVNVVASGVTRVEPGQVDVLLFVNRPTRNVSGDEVYRDQVRARMLDVDGTWLIDCLLTGPDSGCGT